MDNPAPGISDTLPQQSPVKPGHAEQAPGNTSHSHFRGKAVEILCAVASAAALYFIPVAGLLLTTAFVIKLIYDRCVHVIPQDEVVRIINSNTTEHHTEHHHHNVVRDTENIHSDLPDLQTSLLPEYTITCELIAPRRAHENNDATPFSEHFSETASSSRRNTQKRDEELLPVQSVSTTRPLSRSLSSEPITDDELKDEAASVCSDDSDIDQALSSPSEESSSVSKEETETQAKRETPPPLVAEINKDRVGQLSVAVISSDIKLNTDMKLLKSKRKAIKVKNIIPITKHAAKEKIDRIFEKLFCHFIRLSDKSNNTDWKKTNPYENKITKTKLKTYYLDNFFNDQQFGQACDTTTLIRLLEVPFDHMNQDIRWAIFARAVELDDFGAAIKECVKIGNIKQDHIPAEKQRMLFWIASMEAYLNFLKRCKQEYQSSNRVKKTKTLSEIINFDHIIQLAQLNYDIESCSKRLTAYLAASPEERLTEKWQSNLIDLQSKALNLRAKTEKIPGMLESTRELESTRDKVLVGKILISCSEQADKCHKIIKCIDKILTTCSQGNTPAHNLFNNENTDDVQAAKDSESGNLSQNHQAKSSESLRDG